MTTIATDGRIMASDGLLTENDRVCMTDYPKVFRLKDGRIVGFAGNAYNWDGFIAWLENGGDKPPVHEGFACLALSPDGSVTSFDEHGRSFPESAPAAIGSGSDIAIGAMDAGKSAFEAVKIACGRDIHSGGEITVLGFEPRAVKAA